EEAKTPQVAPGLRLPEDGGTMLLDTYRGQPDLIELQQSTGDINHNTKGNILRAAINPIASAKQTIEVPGPHAKVQAHLGMPSIYVNVTQNPGDDSSADKPEHAMKGEDPELPWDRFKIVRMQAKNGKRVVGDIKVAVYGKVSQEQKLVPTNAEQ